jgi:hypothetical protein
LQQLVSTTTGTAAAAAARIGQGIAMVLAIGNDECVAVVSHSRLRSSSGNHSMALDDSSDIQALGSNNNNDDNNDHHHNYRFQCGKASFGRSNK